MKDGILEERTKLETELMEMLVVQEIRGDNTFLTDAFFQERYPNLDENEIKSAKNRYNAQICEKKISDYLSKKEWNEAEKLINDNRKLLNYIREIVVYIKNASELSTSDAQRLKSYGIKCSIAMEDIGLDKTQKEAYTVEQYIMCRKEIDGILEKVDGVSPNDDDNQLEEFEEICKILAKRIKYDHDIACKEQEYQKNVDDACDAIQKNDCEENREKYKEAKQRYDSLDHTTSRNMLGGLLKGECVCAGYAEILRNVLACAGIESIYVKGVQNQRDGHAWNQVNIDGEWYNTDLTWARDGIVRGEKVQILQNDLEFNIDQTSDKMIKPLTHGKYKRDCFEYICSAPSIEYVPETSIGKNVLDVAQKFLNDASENIGVKYVRNIADKLFDTIKKGRDKILNNDNMDGEKDDRQ